MTVITRVSSLFLLSLLVTGCASTITNLTPSKQPRNATGMYPVEVAWEWSQSTIRMESIKPSVVVDVNAYPMRPTLGISNRWETVIPIPSGKNTIAYHFRFDFEYNRFGRPGQDSRLSSGYRLDIVDK